MQPTVTCLVGVLVRRSIPGNFHGEMGLFMSCQGDSPFQIQSHGFSHWFSKNIAVYFKRYMIVMKTAQNNQGSFSVWPLSCSPFTSLCWDHLEPRPFPAVCSLHPLTNPWPPALTTESLSLDTGKSGHFTKALRADGWDSLCFPHFVTLHIAGKKELAGLEPI